MSINCCYNCKNREYRCHSFCKEYILQNENNENIKKIIKESKNKERDYFDFSIGNKIKNRKK